MRPSASSRTGNARSRTRLAQAAADWFRDRGVEVRVPKAEAEIAGLADLGVDAEKFVRASIS